MGGQLRFDDRVVIVTGAGNGLGRCHALLFGSRGAKVVVNDLGGSSDGDGQGSAAADKVVAEIIEAGGQAVANYDSVVDGAKIVQTAMDTWGRVDVVVNNAGILRDKSFHKMSAQDWDLIYQVHVNGAFQVTHAAWPIMREQQFGRVIVTSSAAGIYGNFGQANYSMAKLGLAGFSNTLALEGQKRNIHVNAIAPLAASRMTEGIIPEDLFDAVKPELVTPLVAWLCHADCEETGGLFAKLRWERSEGKIFRIGRPVAPEAVRDAWSEVTDFSTSRHPETITGSMGQVVDNIQAGPSKGGSPFIDVDQALGYVFPALETTYDERDIAIYALGIGAAEDPSSDAGLQLVYEKHSSGFKVLPTFGVIPVVNSILEQATKGGLAPGLSFGLDRLLHGEQKTEVLRPLPGNATLTHKSTLTNIWDKGKGAVIVIETDTLDEDGDLLVRNLFKAFIRGAGGWGGDRGPKASDENAPPDRAPDAVVSQVISGNQALLYRLSGDWNPLHVDPAFATAFGFDRPILHGLCTYGYAARHAIEAFCGGDPRYFKSIECRFADSVFPGETLTTEMWKVSDTRVLFRASVKERESEVLTLSAVELYTEIPKKPEKTSVAPASDAKAEVTAADVFGAIGDHVASHPELTRIGKVYQFRITDPDSSWILDLKEGVVQAGETAADCTLSLSNANFMAMTSGEKSAMKLYMGGDLKISGDLMASQRLEFLKDIERPQPGSAPAEAPPSAPAAPASHDVFLGIGVYVELHPELVDKIGKVFAFELTEPDSAWVVDIKNAPGGVTSGAGKADCTLTLSEADFGAMTRGEIDPMKLYMEGRLKIAGDIMASQKLSFLQKITPEEVAEGVKAKKAAGGVATSVSAPTEASAPGIFAQVSGATATLQFHITEPEGHWVVTPDGAEAGTAEAPVATLTLSDEDLAALASGSVQAGDLFQRGRLRVDGDIRQAHSLDFLGASS